MILLWEDAKFAESRKGHHQFHKQNLFKRVNESIESKAWCSTRKVRRVPTVRAVLRREVYPRLSQVGASNSIAARSLQVCCQGKQEELSIYSFSICVRIRAIPFVTGLRPRSLLPCFCVRSVYATEGAMPFPSSGTYPISGKDVVSFTFDNPSYDVNRPVSHPRPRNGLEPRPGIKRGILLGPCRSCQSINVLFTYYGKRSCAKTHLGSPSCWSSAR